MRNETERIVEEKRIRASQHIVDILPLIDRIPDSAIGEVLEYIDAALKTAKKSIPEKGTERKAAANALVLFGIFILLGGCRTPTEGDKRLNNQNIGAGEFVEKTATEPEVKQAGKDVKENSLTLEKSLDLKPAKPESYSPALSKEARKQSEEEHAVSPFMAFLGGLASVAVGWLLRGGAVRLFSTVAPTAMAGPLGTVATALVEGIARIRQKAQADPDKKVSEEDILSILEVLQSAKGVQPLVDKLRSKIEPKVTGLL